MTEDAAIRLDCDSAEFVHVHHTWSSSFAQNPRNMSHRILGTSPVSSELDISNETDIPRVSLTASTTGFQKPCPGYPGVLLTLPSHGSNHRVAQNLSQTGTGPKHTGYQGYRRLPGQGNCRA